MPICPFEIGQTVTPTRTIEHADNAARWLNHSGVIINRWRHDSDFIDKHGLSGWMYEVRFPDPNLGFVTMGYFHEELQLTKGGTPDSAGDSREPGSQTAPGGPPVAYEPAAGEER